METIKVELGNKDRKNGKRPNQGRKGKGDELNP